MEWTRSETIILAAHGCKQCHGLGLRMSRQNRFAPCKCVFRAVFRACYSRFRQCVTKEKHLSRVSLEFNARGGRRITWGRKNEEYAADFVLVSRRTLSPEDYRLFNYHFLLGADQSLCSRKLGIDRGTFFHRIYRIQAQLGQVFAELKPYALYPLDEYFHGRTESASPQTPEGPQPSPASAVRQPPGTRTWAPLRYAA